MKNYPLVPLVTVPPGTAGRPLGNNRLRHIDDADYYNVTVNLIVKRKSKFASDFDSKNSKLI